MRYKKLLVAAMSAVMVLSGCNTDKPEETSAVTEEVTTTTAEVKTTSASTTTSEVIVAETTVSARIKIVHFKQTNDMSRKPSA